VKAACGSLWSRWFCSAKTGMVLRPI